jgi:hypothetical protein
MMPRKRPSQRKHLKPKAVLRLPDLDQAKSAVLNSLSSVDAQRGYRHAIDELIEWNLRGAEALIQQDCRPPVSNAP